MSKQIPVFVDEVLGEFTTNEGPRRRSKWCHWTGHVLRADERISLALGGDLNGPDPSQLRELRNIVAHIEEVVARASAALAECTPHYVISQFRVASIHSWDEIDGVFEVVFESYDKDARANVETTWPAGRVVAHRVVIARDYRAVDTGSGLRLPPVKYPSDHPDPPLA